MKKAFIYFLISCLVLLISYSSTEAQGCSICAKTTQQMGEGPAKGMNSGIIYLMLTPLILMGYIGFKWWKSNGRHQQ